MGSKKPKIRHDKLCNKYKAGGSGLSMNILHVGDKSPVQSVFFSKIVWANYCPS